jgi:hypothetical protein
MNAIDTMNQAARTVWNNKALWFFGLFAAAGSASSSSGDHGGSNGGGAGGPMPEWVIPVIIVGVLAALAVFVLHIVSEGALIDGVRRARAGAPVQVRAGLSAGLGTFWRVLGLKALLGAVVVPSVLLIVAPTLGAVIGLYPIWVGAPVTIMLGLPGVPWLVTLYFAYEYALRFAVLDSYGVIASAALAWRHLHGRVGRSLALMGVSLLGSVASGGLMLAGLLVAAALGGLVYLIGGAAAGLIAGGVLIVPAGIAVAGALGAYRSSVWTLGYLDPAR